MHRSKENVASILMVEALLILLEKKEYDIITVKEICEKAGVNRTTFYLHYNTKDDLLVDTMKTINKRFFSKFHQIDENFNDSNDIAIDNYLISYLNVIKELKNIYKILQHKTHIFKKTNVNKEIYESLFDKLLTKYDINNDEKKYAYAYFNYGVLAIIDKWIENDCLEELYKIANIIKKLINVQK